MRSFQPARRLGLIACANCRLAARECILNLARQPHLLGRIVD